MKIVGGERTGQWYRCVKDAECLYARNLLSRDVGCSPSFGAVIMAMIIFWMDAHMHTRIDMCVTGMCTAIHIYICR